MCSGNLSDIVGHAELCDNVSTDSTAEIVSRYERVQTICRGVSERHLHSGFGQDPFEELESFVNLSRTGCVEFIAETYYHSLSFMYRREEFIAQVTRHREAVEDLPVSRTGRLAEPAPC